jgi:hypothetical protein
MTVDDSVERERSRRFGDLPESKIKNVSPVRYSDETLNSEPLVLANDFDKSDSRLISLLALSGFGQSEGSRLIWISTGGAFAVLLVTIGGVIFLIGCRQRSSILTSDVTESEHDMAMPADSRASATCDPFLSEENVLSVDGKRRNQIELSHRQRIIRVAASPE